MDEETTKELLACHIDEIEQAKDLLTETQFVIDSYLRGEIDATEAMIATDDLFVQIASLLFVEK